MTALDEIKRLAQKEFPLFIKYICDGLTGALVQNTHFFPMPVRVNFAKEAENPEEKAQILSELYENSKNVCGTGYTLEIELVSTRSKGNRKVLKRICFLTEDDYLAFLIKSNAGENAAGSAGGAADGASSGASASTSAGAGATDASEYETEGFNEAIFAIIESGLLLAEELPTWAFKHLAELGRYHEDEHFWQNICKVARWLKSNKNCNLYIRELPFINSIPPKFIEENKNLIHSLVTQDAIKISFEADHGLLGKQTTVRFRSLCKEVPLMLGQMELKELTVPIEDFCMLPKSGILQGIENVFIVETEMVYLTFPECPKSLCILAQGYNANVLKLCDWLKEFPLYYFGNCSENSFSMLSSLRGYFENLKSFCMDMATINAYKDCLQKGDNSFVQTIPPNLDYAENQAYLFLHDSAEKNCLSQDNISIEYIQKALAQLFHDC
ncbi:MAG: hypothetical protein II413_01935 [Treponema sp.]|nr:hypothetical protein [Treponema sp.]